MKQESFIKIREDVLQNLINGGGTLVATLKGSRAEDYETHEKEDGIPYREILIKTDIDEEALTAHVTIIITKLNLEDDSKELEILADQAITWDAIDLRDNNAKSLIK